jgi:hypothetical protein
MTRATVVSVSLVWSLWGLIGCSYDDFEFREPPKDAGLLPDTKMLHCQPGETRRCPYLGPAGTDGVGECRAPRATCSSQGTWGACDGQVVPTTESCVPDGKDRDCDGVINNDPARQAARDDDNDGYPACKDGKVYDCCDSARDCVTPEAVHPGAAEDPKNLRDDNCNGVIDSDAHASCDDGLQKRDEADIAKDPQNFSVDPKAMAKAIGICSGVERAVFADASGNTARFNKGLFYIKDRSGDLTRPLEGKYMAGIYTSSSRESDSSAPADWLAANGGIFPNAPGCVSPARASANGSALFEVAVKVPLWAHSFSVSTYFYSEEYPCCICSPYNDLFLVLLDSKFNDDNPDSDKKNPLDKNLAFYSNGLDKYPVGVNLATPHDDKGTADPSDDTGIPYDKNGYGLFRHCKDSSNMSFVYSGCIEKDAQGHAGADYLKGTGQFENRGGATGWLTTRGNVVPGETITLRFVIWNTGDHALDSMVLIDKFRWERSVEKPGTVIK